MALPEDFNTTIAIGSLGTQLFWLNKSASSKKFEYAIPLVEGGEYGGDAESFDAPELDLDYVPKIGGRQTLNDVSLSSNYTKERYARWVEILDSTDAQTYLEVFSDGSAIMYAGTSAKPTIQGGDVRQISVTIVPQKMEFVSDVNSITSAEITAIQPMVKDSTGTDITLTALSPLPFDLTTIPSSREYYTDINVGE